MCVFLLICTLMNCVKKICLILDNFFESGILIVNNNRYKSLSHFIDMNLKHADIHRKAKKR